MVLARGYTLVVDYAYDGLYRLVEADSSDGAYYAFRYDRVGNRLAYTATTAPVTYTTYAYDAADRLSSLTRAGVTVDYRWSDRGELLSDGVQTYRWDAAGRLVGVAGPGGPEVAYVYDGANNRVGMSLNGAATAYIVDPFNPVDAVPQVLEEAGGQEARYLYGLDLFAQQEGGATTYLGYDALSVRLHLYSDGAIAEQYRYAPFGEVVGEGRPAGYGFTGERWDEAVGLLYLRARYYAPGVGRFVARDAWTGYLRVPQTMLRGYSYVRNSPLGGGDPSGCFPPIPGTQYANPLLPWTYDRTVSEFLSSAYRDYRRDGNLRNCALESANPSPDATATVDDLLTDFVCERGAEYRVFGGHTHLTQQLAKSLTIHLIRETYDLCTKDVRCSGGLRMPYHGKYKFDNWELITAWIDSFNEGDRTTYLVEWPQLNITQFLGSFEFTIQPLGWDRLEWTVTNRTDLESGTRIPPVLGGVDPEATEKISLEELVWQNPSLLAKPLSWVLEHYPVISVLRPRSRADTPDYSVGLGGGTMRQEFHWVEKWLLPCSGWDWNNWPGMVESCIKILY